MYECGYRSNYLIYHRCYLYHEDYGALDDEFFFSFRDNKARIVVYITL